MQNVRRGRDRMVVYHQ